MDRSEKVDLVASLHKTLSETTVVVVTQQTGMTVTEVEELRSKLDEAVNVNIELSKDNLISECALVFEEETEGMLETEIDRLRTLAEGIEFESLDQFKEKLAVLK